MKFVHSLVGKEANTDDLEGGQLIRLAWGLFPQIDPLFRRQEQIRPLVH